MNEPEISQSMASFKLAIRAAMANRCSFLSKCCTNKFHRLQGLFWIKRSSRKKKFLDLKTDTEKFISSKGGLFAGKRDLLA